ncbi:TPA: hypothetical protein ACH3X1_003250 [Trebouxia sp. C0004]
MEGKRLDVTFKLRSPDTALLDFHTALTAAGKQVEPRFAGPIRVIELLAMFDEMHPSINNAGSKQSFKAAQHLPVHDTAELIRRHAAEQECSPDMRLSFMPLTGKTFRLNVHKSWDIGAVKSLIQIVYGVPPDMMVLILAGRRLENKYLLSDYDIADHDETLVHVDLKLGGN